MSIRIVTDSSSDIPPELAKELGIEIVPLTVVIDGKEYVEGVTVDPSSFVSMMRQSADLPRTSQPSPHAFITAFERATSTANKAAEVLCITLSSKLSGTFQSACAARDLFKGTAKVIDSRSGTLGLGLMALEASRLAALGHSLSEITERIEAMRERLSVFVSLNTLENAVKGGRIRRVEAAVVQLLRMKIFARTQDGEVVVCGKARGRKNMLAAFLEAMQAKAEDYQDRWVGITHVDNTEEAHALAEAVKKRFNPARIIIGPMGSTIATHAGTGAVALAYW
ncbi:MAG: DegV family protein [Firmicutes bacterium]|nr:DegV family protein [Bacillota bacterium]